MIYNEKYYNTYYMGQCELCKSYISIFMMILTNLFNCVIQWTKRPTMFEKVSRSLKYDSKFFLVNKHNIYYGNNG